MKTCGGCGKEKARIGKSDMKTILRMGGASCAGKSTLVSILNEGCYHLLDSAALLGVVEGRKISTAVPKTFIDEAEGGTSHTDWARHLLKRNSAEVLVIEETVAGADFDLRVDGQFDVVNVQLVMPYFAWRARREWRFSHGWDVTAPWVQDGSWELYQAYGERALSIPDGTIYLDVTDYPVREVRRREAETIFATGLEPEDAAAYAPEVTKDASGSSPDYQAALRLGGQWLGEPVAVDEMMHRFVKTLPASLHGAAVLDLGAAEGAFALEAVNRDATFAVAVDARPRRLETVQRVRTAARLPVFTVEMRLGEGPIPNFVARGDGRYDLTLMLNILRHLPEPEARLREALSLTNKLICETMAAEDGEGRIGEPPRQAFSPQWMQRVGEEEGFSMQVREAALQPDRRLMYVFERDSS